MFPWERWYSSPYRKFNRGKPKGPTATKVGIKVNAQINEKYLDLGWEVFFSSIMANHTPPQVKYYEINDDTMYNGVW